MQTYWFDLVFLNPKADPQGDDALQHDSLSLGN
jgi:hypothetical protein